MIDEMLQELKDTWDFTAEELADIKEKMLNYAGAALMDSKIREEIIKDVVNENKI